MIGLLIAGITVFALVIGAFVTMWIVEERRYNVYRRGIHKDIVAEKNTEISELIDVKKLMRHARDIKKKGVVTHDHISQARPRLRITDTGAQKRNRLTRWQNRA